MSKKKALERFFFQLATLEADWELTKRSRIRCMWRGACTCPIHRVAGLPGDRLPLATGKSLGLDPVDIMRLVQAADEETPRYPELRKKLLAACHLT